MHKRNLLNGLPNESLKGRSVMGQQFSSILTLVDWVSHRQVIFRANGADLAKPLKVDVRGVVHMYVIL